MMPLARLRAAGRPHDLRAIAPPGDHRRQGLGRILQVGRHHDGRVAFDLMQAAGDRDVRSGVAREAEAANARVAQREGLDHRERVVAGMVVDDHPLPVAADASHRLDETVVELREIGRLVERRRDDRQHQ